MTEKSHCLRGFPANFTGTDILTFTAVDSGGNSMTGLVTVAVLPLTLQFNTTLQFATEGMRLQVDGVRSTNPVVIYASTDPVSLDSIATNAPSRGSLQLLDPTARDFAQRYYRAVQP